MIIKSFADLPLTLGLTPQHLAAALAYQEFSKLAMNSALTGTTGRMGPAPIKRTKRFSGNDCNAMSPYTGWAAHELRANTRGTVQPMRGQDFAQALKDERGRVKCETL